MTIRTIGLWILRAGAALVGWTLFIWSWRLVTLPSVTPVSYVQFAMAHLLRASILLVAISTLWVQHNLRLAKANRRNSVSRLIRVDLLRDHLDRAIHLGEGAAACQAISVDIHGGTKRFLALDLGGSLLGGASPATIEPSFGDD